MHFSAHARDTSQHDATKRAQHSTGGHTREPSSPSELTAHGGCQNSSLSASSEARPAKCVHNVASSTARIRSFPLSVHVAGERHDPRLWYNARKDDVIWEKHDVNGLCNLQKQKQINADLDKEACQDLKVSILQMERQKPKIRWYKMKTPNTNTSGVSFLSIRAWNFDSPSNVDLILLRDNLAVRSSKEFRTSTARVLCRWHRLRVHKRQRQHPVHRNDLLLSRSRLWWKR